MDVTDIKDWIEQADEYEKRADEFLKSAQNVRSRAMENCGHPAVLTSESYYSGNACHRSHTDYEQTCAICGKMLKEWSESN